MYFEHLRARRIAMDDMERYGDYNEIDVPPGKNPVLTLIKIVAVILIFAIIGFVGFRIFTINYYPKEMKSIYFTEALESYYNKHGGDITVYTQKLYAPYDDEKEGNFICDHLRFVPDAGHLQVTVRFNNSLFDDIERDYGIKLDPNDRSVFTFRLWLSGDDTGTGRLVDVVWDEFLMYQYAKVVFDEVDFDNVIGAKKDNWICLEILIDGVQDKDKKTGEKHDRIYRIAVLENMEKYTSIKEYELKNSEVPR